MAHFARLRPVYPGASWNVKGIDPFRQVRADMLRRMRQALTQTTFSKKAQAAFARAMTIRVTGQSLRVQVNHPGWLPLVEGQRRQQMSWLVKAKAPIPIVTETGEVIFRSATPKTMANGKWVHPGRAPVDFAGKARKAVQKFVQERFAKQVAAQVQQALRR